MITNFFKIIRGLYLNPQAAAPASPSDGGIYYDSVLQKFQFRESAQWKNLGGSGAIQYLKNPGAESDLSNWTIYTNKVGISFGSSTADIGISTGHGLQVGDPVTFTGSVSSGLALDTVYYVVYSDTNVVRLALTPGGTPIVCDNSLVFPPNFLAPLYPTNIAQTAPPAIPYTPGVSIPFAFSVSATDPLRGSKSFIYEQLAPGSADEYTEGQGVESDPFTIDEADQGQVISVSCDWLLVSGDMIGYPNEPGVLGYSELSIWFWDVVNNVRIQPTVSHFPGASVGIPNRFVATFQSAINSTQYKMILHQGLRTSNAFQIKLDNFAVGPQFVSMGPAMTDWQAFTPVVTGLGAGSYVSEGYYRRVGDAVELAVGFVKDGTPGSGGSVVNFLFPPGMAGDPDKINPQTSNTGPAFKYDAGSANWVPFTGSVSNGDGLGITNGGGLLTGSDVDADDRFYIRGTVPILGWSSNTLMSDNADTRVVVAQATTVGSPAKAADVPWEFANVNFDTHGGWISSSLYRVPVAGFYKLSGSVYTGSTPERISGYKNSVLQATAGVIDSGGNGVFTVTIEAKAGDELYISSETTAGTITVNLGTINIERVSGPAQIAASEKVLAIYQTATGAAPVGVSIFDADTKVVDTHGLVKRDGLGDWYFECPTPGFYQVSAQAILEYSTAWLAGQGANFSIWVNGVQRRGLAISQTDVDAVNIQIPLNGTARVQCLAGDRISIRIDQNSAGSKPFLAAADWNFIEVSRE